MLTKLIHADMHIIYKDQNGIAIRGQINFRNIVDLRQHGETLISLAIGPCNINLSEVYYAHTAAISLLLCWIRHANKQGKTIFFTNIPLELMQLLKLSNLQDLIPVGVS